MLTFATCELRGGGTETSMTPHFSASLLLPQVSGGAAGCWVQVDLLSFNPLLSDGI